MPPPDDTVCTLTIYYPLYPDRGIEIRFRNLCTQTPRAFSRCIEDIQKFKLLNPGLRIIYSFQPIETYGKTESIENCADYP